MDDRPANRPDALTMKIKPKQPGPTRRVPKEIQEFQRVRARILKRVDEMQAHLIEVNRILKEKWFS
jgi:hypothetical protein